MCVCGQGEIVNVRALFVSCVVWLKLLMCMSVLDPASQAGHLIQTLMCTQYTVCVFSAVEFKGTCVSTVIPCL